MNSLGGARAYLAKLPPAISGAGGHNATFRAACCLYRLGLRDNDALLLFREWNGTHCHPPWTDKELAHKPSDARKVASVPQRLPLRAPASVRVVWKLERNPSPAPIEPPPADYCPLAPTVEAERSPPAPLSPFEPCFTPEQAAWLPVARQVLDGEFEGCDRSTRESLTIGLRSIPHPHCQQALIRLQSHPTGSITP
jgi:hypothetical protein